MSNNSNYPQHTVASLAALVFPARLYIKTREHTEHDVRRSPVIDSPGKPLPLEDESAKEGTNEDANDDVAVVIHSEPSFER